MSEPAEVTHAEHELAVSCTQAIRAVGKSRPSRALLRDMAARGFPTEADVRVARTAYMRQFQPSPPSPPQPSSSPSQPNSAIEADRGTREAVGSAGPSGASLAMPSQADASKAAPTPRMPSAAVMATQRPMDAGGCSVQPPTRRRADVLAEALAQVETANKSAAILEEERDALRHLAAEEVELEGLMGGRDGMRTIHAEMLPSSTAAISAKEAQGTDLVGSDVWGAAAALVARSGSRLMEGLSRIGAVFADLSSDRSMTPQEPASQIATSADCPSTYDCK